MSSQTIVGKLAIELGISDDKLQAGLAQAITASQAAGQKMANAVNRGASKGEKAAFGGNAMGLLNLSRAIDDAQYGFRGIVNNIEGVVTGFGLSAGIAGAATIAAVAANMLAPAIEAGVSKIIDGRTEMQKLADQTRFAASNFGELNARIAGTAREIEKLAKSDANAGFLGSFRRNTGIDTDAINKQRAFLFAQLTEQNMLDQRQAQKNSDAMNAAMGFLDPGENAEARKARAEATKRALPNEFQRNLAFGQLTDKLAGSDFGGDFTRARERARELVGQAVLGIEDGFKALNKIKNGKLEAERIKILAENIREAQEAFDRETGAPAELMAMADREKRILGQQFGTYEQGVAAFDRLSARRSAIEMNMNRSEILGSAAEVFGRNINAGMEDPQLKELREIKEEIRNLQPLTGLQ